MATPVVTGAPERHRELFEELMREVAAYNPEADRDLLERAFIYGSRAHEGQQRRSGEDFILHPLGVARILGELGADDPTLAAALVHDVVEDTGATIEEVQERVRRRGRPPRRRSHEADSDPVPEPRARTGGELPQDDRRDGAGPPRHPHQAR